MANDFYRKGAELILGAGVNWSADDIQAFLVADTYIANLSADQYLSELLSKLLSNGISLTSKTRDLGAFDADDVTFPAVAAGGNALAVILVKWTGDATTSPLLVYLDVLTGFPFATNGGDIVVQWNNGATKIFCLTSAP